MRAQNEVDRLAAFLAQERVLRGVRAHAEHLREHQRSDPVAIHARAIGVAEIAVGILRFRPQHEIERLAHSRAFRRRIAGLMPLRREREDRERGHGGFVPPLDQHLAVLLVAIVDRPAHGILREEQELRRPLERLVHVILSAGNRAQPERPKQHDAPARISRDASTRL